MKLIDEIVASAAELTRIRRHLHAHPELSYEEHATSDYVAKLLEEWGIEVHRGMAKTGVVGVLKNGTSSRAIGLRADMDALPILEKNTFAHASTAEGKMHACGHDGHTTMLLGAAQYLARHKNFDGTVYFIFQPAEEHGAGGKTMVDEGLFEKFPMDAVFGMHNWPDLPAGMMAVSPGPVMASSNDFKLTITGRGGHAAMPHLNIDPLPITCQIILAWQNIISRERNPLDRSVLSVTTVHAGDAFNVIPQNCKLTGTVRTFSKQSTDMIEKRMREMAENICAAYQATCVFEFERNYAATVNWDKEAEFARQTMLSILHEDRIVPQTPSMGAEDFGFMLAIQSGAYVFLGQAQGADAITAEQLPPCALHNPGYDFNDEAIPLGVTYWVRLAERFLG